MQYSRAYWSLLFTDYSFGSRRSETMMYGRALIKIENDDITPAGQRYEVGIQPLNKDQPELLEVHEGENSEVTSLFTLSQTISWAAMDAPSAGMSRAVTAQLWRQAEILSRGVQSANKSDYNFTIDGIRYWRTRVWRQTKKVLDTQGEHTVAPDADARLG